MSTAHAWSFLLLVVAHLPTATYAWWDTGHMLTAAVALQNLPPAQRAEAHNLLSNLPGYTTTFSNNFISAAHWADDIKRNHDAYSFSTFHFIDFPYPNRSSCDEDTVDTQNIVVALDDMVNTLRNSSAPGWTRAFALRFTIHLLGDIHQPLHCVSRCTPLHPKGDRGGNLFKLDDPNYTNLHKLWDSMGGQYQNTIAALCPYNDLSACHTNEAQRRQDVVQEADNLILEYPMKDMPEFSKSSNSLNINTKDIVWGKELFTSYARSSFEIVKEGRVYGDVVEGDRPSSEYLQYVQQTTRRRVALGGYRLSQLLTTNLATSNICNSNHHKNNDPSYNGNRGLVVALVVVVVLLCCVVVYFLVMERRRGKEEGIRNMNRNTPPPFQAL
jgi:hypothetical protein